MKIIEPSATLIDDINPAQILKKLELCGRVSRKSEANITADSAEKFVRSLIKRGHESVLEHVSLTFHIICDRAIMAELTRHRLAAFTVESTRYIKYGSLKVIAPALTPVHYQMWEESMENIEHLYLSSVNGGQHPPEIARAVLPLCLATELYMTCNLRELRHILKLRTASKVNAAHPQMRQIMGQVLDIMREKLPVIVEDIPQE